MVLWFAEGDLEDRHPKGYITALLNETTCTYDERGRKLTETDAELQTTTWGYDEMGRQVRRTLPLGQEEFSTYDVWGRKDSHIDFNGETAYYFYDGHGRLEHALYPDLTGEHFEYDALGRRVLVEDSRGYTFTSYNNRGWVDTVTNPDGSQIWYTYDNQGNRLSVMCEHLAELRGDEPDEVATKKCVAEARQEGVSQRQARCRIHAINKQEYWTRCRTGEARRL